MVTEGANIVVVGTAQRPGKVREHVLALARFNGNGERDPSFGEGGALLTNFGAFNTYAGEGLSDPVGRIVVAGHIESDAQSPGDFLVTRFTRDGQPDVGFREVTDFRDAADQAQAIALQGDRIVVAGTVGDRTPESDDVGPAIGVARYRP